MVTFYRAIEKTTSIKMSCFNDLMSPIKYLISNYITLNGLVNNIY